MQTGLISLRRSPALRQVPVTVGTAPCGVSLLAATIGTLLETSLAHEYGRGYTSYGSVVVPAVGLGANVEH